MSAAGWTGRRWLPPGVLTIVPGAIVIWFVRHYIAKGFAMGRVERMNHDNSPRLSAQAPRAAAAVFGEASARAGDAEPRAARHSRRRMFDWMAWTLPVAVFFTCIVLMLIGMTVWEIKSPTTMRKGFCRWRRPRGDRLFIGLLSAAYVNLIFWASAARWSSGSALSAEMSVWISFVASMALLVLICAGLKQKQPVALEEYALLAIDLSKAWPGSPRLVPVYQWGLNLRETAMKTQFKAIAFAAAALAWGRLPGQERPPRSGSTAEFQPSTLSKTSRWPR